MKKELVTALLSIGSGVAPGDRRRCQAGKGNRVEP